MHDYKTAQDFFDGQLLLIDKPYEWTSFNVVRKIQVILKNRLGIKKIKVGHAGTLDPLATGLMLICTGKYTKRIDEFQGMDKQYLAGLTLGATTPSFDRETEIDKRFETQHITKSLFLQAIKKFTGEIEQVPPVFSAVNVNGKRAYEYARKGKMIELKAKKIRIQSIDIEQFEIPDVKIRIFCGKGTYIRSLVRDLGKELESGAYLTSLCRESIGKYQLKNALSIQEFEDSVKALDQVRM